jgi:uncharacterized protein YceH (UPF0502 family)
MKNIRTISRGTNGVALQFKAKESSSEIEYRSGEFNFTAPVLLNGTEIPSDAETRIAALEAKVIELESRIVALEP